MELSEGLKLKDRPVAIPDCNRADLAVYLKKMGLELGVEVGVYRGEYTEVLAKSGLKIYGIDPWLSYEDYEYDKWQSKHDYNLEQARKRLAVYPNVVLIRKMSMDAVRDFADESLDFVYIDGNHRFKFIAEDLMEWSRKVRTGGIIAGHDYAYFKHRYLGGGCQVHEIVDAFSRSFELNFWVLGRREVRRGEKRDRMRSWMFIKNWKNQ
jgi:hypothetical protein